MSCLTVITAWMFQEVPADRIGLFGFQSHPKRIGMEWIGVIPLSSSTYKRMLREYVSSGIFNHMSHGHASTSIMKVDSSFQVFPTGVFLVVFLVLEFSGAPIFRLPFYGTHRRGSPALGINLTSPGVGGRPFRGLSGGAGGVRWEDQIIPVKPRPGF